MGNKNMSFFDILIIFFAGLMAGYFLFGLLHNTKDLLNEDKYCPYCGNLLEDDF